MRFNFISVLSHELKAPLNAIEGYLKILQDDEPPERRQMIDRSLMRLDGMSKLIFDLLDLTRIESGQKARQFATVDVRTIAQRTIDLFAAEATDRKISITLRAPQPVEHDGRSQRDWRSSSTTWSPTRSSTTATEAASPWPWSARTTR